MEAKGMYYDNKIWIGLSGEEKIGIEPKMANRHGLIAGATGTGKTVTLKVMAESFSQAGVPVFLADVKGDLAGICNSGVLTEDMQNRIQRFGLQDTGFAMQPFPVEYWDIYAKGGIPLRTTISEMGPLLLSRLMELNDSQTDLLTVVFKIADDQNLLLIDTKDLKSMLNFVAENSKEYSETYGNIAKQSIHTILRGVVALEAQGGDLFFGEPGLNLADWFDTREGKGVINILDSRELMMNGTMYATFLLWMLSELFELLPEVGDMEKPRMVFFFDEAHLLFKDISKALRSKIEQVVKLIRSKGVGIYFVTQNPKDIPDEVLAQLGNKIQHALRAYTPNEEKALKAAAASFRANPEFDTKEVLSALGTGEALVSVLDAQGIPGIVKKCSILPPQSQFGSIADMEREQKIVQSNLYLRYKDSVDSDSAYEVLLRENEELERARQRLAEEEAERKQAEKEAVLARRLAEKEEAAAIRQAKREETAAKRQAEKEAEAARKKAEKEQEKKNTMLKSATRSVASTAGGTVGREIGNTVGKTFGGTFGKKLGGNVGAAIGRNLLGSFFRR
jgi:hypothetical protein